MNAAYDPGAWQDFAVGLLTASPTLLGPIFVVVSLHLLAVIDEPVLRRRPTRPRALRPKHALYLPAF